MCDVYNVFCTYPCNMYRYSGCLLLHRVPGVHARRYIIIIIHLGTHIDIEGVEKREKYSSSHSRTSRRLLGNAHRKTRIYFGLPARRPRVFDHGSNRRKLVGITRLLASFEFLFLFLYTFFPPPVVLIYNIVPMDCCSSVFSGHTHHSLYKLLYIIILCRYNACWFDRRHSWYIYIYINIQIVRAAVNTEVEVFDFAATAGVKTFSSECAGPVSPLCCCRYCCGCDHGRVVHRRFVRRNKHNATLRALTHAHTHTNIRYYWYNVPIYLYLYVWHEIRRVYAK